MEIPSGSHSNWSFDLDQILFFDVSPPTNLVTGAPNPKYVQWKKKDQLLLSWLRSSMSKPILASVATLNTSYTVWRALERDSPAKQKLVFSSSKANFLISKKPTSQSLTMSIKYS
ncbi:hypothetical protein CsatB_027219 [Cannabis sativa]